MLKSRSMLSAGGRWSRVTPPGFAFIPWIFDLSGVRRGPRSKPNKNNRQEDLNGYGCLDSVLNEKVSNSTVGALMPLRI